LQPVHGRVELILVRIGDAQLVGQRGIGPRPRQPELARLGRNDAPGHHGRHQVALARRFGIDQFVEPHTPHGRQHRRDVAVRR
jgi:hypothetical protein